MGTPLPIGSATSPLQTQPDKNTTHNPATDIFHSPAYEDGTDSSETSAIRTQTLGKYPKRNKLHLEHGKSLKTRRVFMNYTIWDIACFDSYSIVQIGQKFWETW